MGIQILLSLLLLTGAFDKHEGSLTSVGAHHLCSSAGKNGAGEIGKFGLIFVTENVAISDNPKHEKVYRSFRFQGGSSVFGELCCHKPRGVGAVSSKGGPSQSLGIGRDREISWFSGLNGAAAALNFKKGGGGLPTILNERGYAASDVVPHKLSAAYMDVRANFVLAGSFGYAHGLSSSYQRLIDPNNANCCQDYFSQADQKHISGPLRHIVLVTEVLFGAALLIGGIFLIGRGFQSAGDALHILLDGNRKAWLRFCFWVCLSVCGALTDSGVVTYALNGSGQ